MREYIIQNMDESMLALYGYESTISKLLKEHRDKLDEIILHMLEKALGKSVDIKDLKAVKDALAELHNLGYRIKIDSNMPTRDIMNFKYEYTLKWTDVVKLEPLVLDNNDY